MREKILEEGSDFVQNLVMYLESVHRGEYVATEHSEMVSLVRSYKRDPPPGYRNPVETLPVSPPPVCSEHGLIHFVRDCDACCDYSRWSEEYIRTTDELICRSNTHNCKRGLNKDGSVRHNHYKRCTETPNGKCKARFPRPIYERSLVDPDTGTLYLKKLEPWLNTFTPEVTSLYRCNTDVTYMGSGTAVKAVVVYISDYITKASLKTHVMFDVIQAILADNVELLSGAAPRSEVFRRLGVKMLNKLVTKMEHGAPMISMYLLGNPDHYTDHTFKPFYWRNYVCEVNNYWNRLDVDGNMADEKICVAEDSLISCTPLETLTAKMKTLEIDADMVDCVVSDYVCVEAESDVRQQDVISDVKKKTVVTVSPQKQSATSIEEGTVALIKKDGKVSGYSPVDDYIHRADELEDMCVYEFVRLSTRVSLKRARKRKGRQHELSITDKVNNESLNFSRNCFPFRKPHPLADTHACHISGDKPKLALNFISNTLPRRDSNDREYYCMTMLTFFKPWRSGADLKPRSLSWKEAFDHYSFTSREEELMANFNIRYECLDARDDYRAQLLKEESKTSSWDVLDRDWLLEDHDEEFVLNQEQTNFVALPEGISADDQEMINVCIRDESGRLNLSLVHEREVEQVSLLLSKLGWCSPRSSVGVDQQSFGIQRVRPVRFAPPRKASSEWRRIVLQQRQSIVKSRFGLVTGTSNRPLTSGNPVPGKGHFGKSGRVKVIPHLKSFLQKNFDCGDDQHYIERACCDFRLNAEQERAFRIVANHASSPYSDQLKMLIFGMGGTGKSQVLKALAKFFEARQESYRFMVVAPTGTAAALLGGSTYHSVLSINEYTNERGLPAVRERLLGVNYIFLDEVSMVSCHELYLISKRLAEALVEGTSFGGMNMIFAGDFAQLPPVKGGETGALYSEEVGRSGTNMRKQESTMGKALWHEVNTVVVLRENMRIAVSNEDDIHLRNALENMRYKFCTPADIAFLKSRIACPTPGMDAPCLSDDHFRNVPIITARNLHKDAINSIGSERYSIENSERLTNFYSEDVFKPPPDEAKRKRRGAMRSNVLTQELQEELWERPSSASDDHLSPKLRLCRDMPVMIRTNLATEMCITKGQEGFVYGWESRRGTRGQLMLDTLFVTLKDPPTPVQIDGLPPNVVPIVPSTKDMWVRLKNDTSYHIARTQVEILPCFAMTDYASQGKTRRYNPVDLKHCRSFHGIYTALSRSASGAGTLIIRPFDIFKITGGVSKSLLREYREIELLDDLTDLQFRGELPASVSGTHRVPLLKSFRRWKGDDYVPRKTHTALHWSSKNPLVDLEMKYDQWQIIKKSDNDTSEAEKQVSFVPVLDKSLATSQEKAVEKDAPCDEEMSLDLQEENDKKRKRDCESEPIGRPGKRRHIGSSAYLPPTRSLTGGRRAFLNRSGPVWSENSCAYDSVSSVLYTLWASDPDRWDEMFDRSGNVQLQELKVDFESCRVGEITIENVRDNIRSRLRSVNDSAFGWGIYTNAFDILETMFSMTEPLIEVRNRCRSNHGNQVVYYLNTPSLLRYNDNTATSTSEFITCPDYENGRRCGEPCGAATFHSFTYLVAPDILLCDIYSARNSQFYIDQLVHLDVNGGRYRYALRGVIYFENNHYISRSIDEEGGAWKHDGMSHKSGDKLVWSGSMNRRRLNINICDRTMMASIAIYARMV